MNESKSESAGRAAKFAQIWNRYCKGLYSAKMAVSFTLDRIDPLRIEEQFEELAPEHQELVVQFLTQRFNSLSVEPVIPESLDKETVKQYRSTMMRRFENAAAVREGRVKETDT